MYSANDFFSFNYEKDHYYSVVSFRIFDCPAQKIKVESKAKNSSFVSYSEEPLSYEFLEYNLQIDPDNTRIKLVMDDQGLTCVNIMSLCTENNINVLGTILTIQEALKSFGEEGGGVINFGSVVIHNAAENGSIYAASKSAVASLTSSLPKELGPKNIRVNLVNPGATET